jgi:hypothetical protein
MTKLEKETNNWEFHFAFDELLGFFTAYVDSGLQCFWQEDDKPVPTFLEAIEDGVKAMREYNRDNFEVYMHFKVKGHDKPKTWCVYDFKHNGIHEPKEAFPIKWNVKVDNSW